ncbi:MAG: hypothetical protein R3178_06455, partial [Rhodothermales bacterium]|nr:hypothetical protein [Rhodothermales bacterium]
DRCSVTRIRDMIVACTLTLLAVAPAAVLAQSAPGGSVLESTFVRDVGKQGLDHLYNLEFEDAQAAFTRIDRRFPGHPIGPFLQSLTIWWEILLDIQDRSRDDAFYRAMDEVIKRSDRMLDRDRANVDAMFFKGAALGFRGRLKSNRGDWFKAAMDGKKAMDYVLAVPEVDAGNPDFVFGKGLYDYFAAIVPRRYPFVKPVMAFFPKGDRELGLQEIQRTADSGYFIRAEAAYFLLQINYLYELDYEGCLKYVNWLRDQYPRNSFFHALEGRIYAKWNQRDRAATVFRDIVDLYQEHRTGYNDPLAEQALYYLARLRMSDRDYDGALTYLLQLEALSARSADDTYFKVVGRLRQGMAYDALGRRTLATTRYREVLKMRDHARAHDRAERYLKNPYRG